MLTPIVGGEFVIVGVDTIVGDVNNVDFSANYRRLQSKASESDQGKIHLLDRQQSPEDSLSSHEGYYEKMDRQAAGLEPDPYPACRLFRRTNVRLMPYLSFTLRIIY